FLSARRRNTRFSRDWSSDVCSSDLVVLASRNKDLGTSDAVAAVGIRLSLGAQDTQVGTAMGLGQTHGAGPNTGNQLGQVDALLLFGTMGFHRRNGTMAQAGIHTPCPVGAADHFAH